MSEAQRTYRRDLALYCLTREPAPVTAADLAIGMQAAAQVEGHPRALWGWLDGVNALGVLRSLHKAGQAAVAERRRDSTAGRDVPCWVAASDERTPMPAAPGATEDMQTILQTVDRLRTATAAATGAPEDFNTALRALCAHQAEFIARFVDATQAPPVANDD